MIDFIYFLRTNMPMDEQDKKYGEWIEKYYRKTENQRIGVNHRKRTKRVIVSLTTIPSRVDTIWITIESLLRQRYKADKIIIWVADEIDIADIHRKLEKQIKRGLEIRQCENLGPHKKYFFAFQEFRNDLVVTVDDDVIYSENMLRDLVRAYVKKPNCIYCHRSRYITFKGDGTIRPYEYWLPPSKGTMGVDRESKLNFFTGAGGVLYPVRLMPADLFDKEIIEKTCWRADDVWLYMHAIKSGIPICNVNGNCGNVLVIERSQKEALWKTNLKKKGNDEYIAAVEEAMGVSMNELIKGEA